MIYFKSSPQRWVSVTWDLQIYDVDSAERIQVSQLLCDQQMSEINWNIRAGTHDSQLVLETTECVDSAELHSTLDVALSYLSAKAMERGAIISGGGAFPLQFGKIMDIHPTDHSVLFEQVQGVSLRHLPTNGLRIRIGCRDGDEALYFSQRLMEYAPILIAMSANSPFVAGIDSGFDCVRLPIMDAYPHRGFAPPMRDWEQLSRHIERLIELGVIEGTDELMWDFRPNHRLGCVEIALCDSPLELNGLTQLVEFTLAIIKLLESEVFQVVPADLYHVYSHNRFQSCHQGFRARIIDVQQRSRVSLSESFIALIAQLRELDNHAVAEATLQHWESIAHSRQNSAEWLRQLWSQQHDMRSVIRAMTAQLHDSSANQKHML